jgi:hypothetical protein
VRPCLLRRTRGYRLVVRRSIRVHVRASSTHHTLLKKAPLLARFLSFGTVTGGVFRGLSGGEDGPRHRPLATGGPGRRPIVATLDSRTTRQRGTGAGRSRSRRFAAAALRTAASSTRRITPDAASDVPGQNSRCPQHSALVFGYSAPVRPHQVAGSRVTGPVQAPALPVDGAARAAAVQVRVQGWNGAGSLGDNGSLARPSSAPSRPSL